MIILIGSVIMMILGWYCNMLTLGRTGFMFFTLLVFPAACLLCRISLEYIVYLTMVVILGVGWALQDMELGMAYAFGVLLQGRSIYVLCRTIRCFLDKRGEFQP